ncbi:MAG: adenosylmethionine--8-amino-7-oxononanoate transaminase [Stellaceae bacterium]
MTTRPEWLAGLPHLWLPYAQMKTAPAPLPVRGVEGCRIILEDGRVLIDGMASWLTACHGYRHPHIEEAVVRQLETMPHVMFAGLVHEPAVRLSSRLARVLPGDLDHVFFSESGSVAVEIALKISAQYWLNRGEARSRYLAFKDGYHGDTLWAMSVSDPARGMHRALQRLLPQQLIAELPRDAASAEALERLLEREGGDLAAVIVEPLVQGAGGMVFHETEVLRRVAEAARRHGVLLICDEVFTGFGRTGSLFACEEAGVLPDIIALSKALTGGTLPLAATIARRHVFAAFLSDDPAAALMHGPTFMANALACAAAHASLDLFEREPRLAQVASIAESLARDLAPCAGLAGVRSVRVKGAVGVVELETEPDRDGLVRRFVEAGAWIRPFGNIVYVTPPFTIAPDELDCLTHAIYGVLSGE